MISKKFKLLFALILGLITLVLAYIYYFSKSNIYIQPLFNQNRITQSFSIVSEYFPLVLQPPADFCVSPITPVMKKRSEYAFRILQGIINKWNSQLKTPFKKDHVKYYVLITALEFLVQGIAKIEHARREVRQVLKLIQMATLPETQKSSRDRALKASKEHYKALDFLKRGLFVPESILGMIKREFHNHAK